MGNRFASTIVKKLSSDVVPEILRFTLRCLRLDELSWLTRHQFPVTQMSINAGKPTWISAIKVFTITFKSGKKKKKTHNQNWPSLVTADWANQWNIMRDLEMRI